MDKFTASNGQVVDRYSHSLDVGNGCLWIEPWAVDTLREFFRAERDEELGRWRWRENPDYVVYPRADHVQVVNEASGNALNVTREQAGTSIGLSNAAAAYFEAHPEPKLWEDAKEGDVWLLTINGEEEALLFRHDRTFISRDGDEFAPEESYITAGHRIWPEVSDADR